MSIYLIYGEQKDRASLESFMPALEHRGMKAVLLNPRDDVTYNDGACLRSFVSESEPIAVIASARMKSVIDCFRGPEKTFIVGVEHGIAPFKKYTYGQHLLNAHFYLAPTRLWLRRLADCYPEHSHKLILGGYPKIEVIREHMRLDSVPDERLKQWKKSVSRKLVIFSWGVSYTSLDRLPDMPNIVYLLHPANAILRKPIPLKRALVLSSTPELSGFLLANADSIFGDFSSLSLEALSLGLKVHIFIDRQLYDSDCDLDPKFFDRSSASFGAIPSSPFWITPKEALDMGELCQALKSDNIEFESWTPPSEILCPAGEDCRNLTGDAFVGIINSHKHNMLRYSPKDINRANVRLDLALGIAKSYSDILRRNPDLEGLVHYVDVLDKSSSSLARRAISLIDDLLRSKEAAPYLSGSEWPRIRFEDVPR